MEENGSRCKQGEGLVDKAHPLKKLIDRFHIPPYYFLSREDDDDVRDIGKHDFHSVLPHPMLSDANLIWGALIGAYDTVLLLLHNLPFVIHTSVPCLYRLTFVWLAQRQKQNNQIKKKQLYLTCPRLSV